VGGLVDGRDLVLDGTKLDGIEVGADVTTATNVEAAGAVMDTDFSSDGIVVRTGVGSYDTRELVAASGRISITNPIGLGGDFVFDVIESNINISNLGGFDPNRYIDHSTIGIDVSSVGDGLSGGGDATAVRTLQVDIEGQPVVPALAANDLFMVWDFSANQIKQVDFSSFVLAAAFITTTPIYNEMPTVNAGTPFMVLANIPLSNTERVYLNGVRQAVGNDYTIAADNITFDFNLLATDVVVVDYEI